MAAAVAKASVATVVTAVTLKAASRFTQLWGSGQPDGEALVLHEVLHVVDEDGSLLGEIGNVGTEFGDDEVSYKVEHVLDSV